MITTEDVKDLLKRINPAAQHHERTWATYAERMGLWLSAAGYLVPASQGWLLEDQGEVRTTTPSRFTDRRELVFLGDTSPATAVEAFRWLHAQERQTWADIEAAGYHNAMRVLQRFGFVECRSRRYATIESQPAESVVRAIWEAARNEPVMQEVTDFLREHPTASGRAVGEFVNDRHGRGWLESTEVRVGNGLKQWATWVMKGMKSGGPPDPSSHNRRSKRSDVKQTPLFELPA